MILMTVGLACSCGSSMIFDAKTRLITLDTTKPPEEKKAPRVWFTLLYETVPQKSIIWKHFRIRKLPFKLLTIYCIALQPPGGKKVAKAAKTAATKVSTSAWVKKVYEALIAGQDAFVENFDT